MRFDDVVERLASLPAPLPEGAPELIPVLQGMDLAAPGTLADVRSALRPAGVLALIYPDADGLARVVLTERATRDGHHSGEVSLPGGKAEANDADIAATALREAAEEVGLDALAAEVRVVGLLDRFVIPVSEFDVTPVVAVATRRPSLVASADEVARIVERAGGDLPARRADHDGRARRSASGRCATAPTTWTACPSGARRPGSSASWERCWPAST